MATEIIVPPGGTPRLYGRRDACRYTAIIHRDQTCLGPMFGARLGMTLPSQPVMLTVEQLAELNRQLSVMRHDINNHLSLILAAAELLRIKPELAERMQTMLHEQPSRIGESMAKFTTQFEQTLGITRS